MIEQCTEFLYGSALVDYGQMALMGAGVLLGATAATLYRRRTRGRKYSNDAE